MSLKLYALLLEDVRKDAELLKELLIDEGFDLEMDVVETETDYVSNLKRHNYDIIFADFTLPGFNGQAALDLAKRICPNIPFICISGTIGEDRAVELLKQGATDYVLKDRMERLAFATKRALDAAAQLNKFRQTEIELQTNRQLLQTIINNALDAIYIKDINGRYLLLNEASEKAIGKTAAEIIGKDDTQFFPANQVQMIQEIDKKVLETGLPLTIEESVTLADNNIHIFHVIKCPMFDDYGKVSGLFGIARDVTERIQMEQNLIQAKEKAEESDRLKTAFLHNISHEIRTPMNAIIGFAGFLNNPQLAPEKRQYYIDIIDKSCNRLLSIITDIINIATIEAGQENINESDIDLNATLEYLHEHFQFVAKKQNVQLNLMLYKTDSEIRIVSDATKLTQILTNLIDNALKFTKEGYINIGYILKDNKIEFFVEDSGIGIPPEMHEEIFKRFHQVERTDSRTYGGSGLGLSISKAYTELLGGKIWLKSELEKGSTFYFTIPYNKAKKNVNSENFRNDKISENKSSKTLLIAEDEELNFRLLTEFLSGLNFNIIRAQNGLEAVDLCKSNRKIDLVLMDIKMPVMDGFEATRQIKEILPDITVIAQTAYSNEEDKNKALASGCIGVISKPFNKEFFINKLNSFISIK